MLETWRPWTCLTQGCHKPSTCEKKKKNNKTHTHTHTQSVKCNKVKPSRMKCAWTNFKNSGGNIWRCLAPPKTSLTGFVRFYSLSFPQHSTGVALKQPLKQRLLSAHHVLSTVAGSKENNKQKRDCPHRNCNLEGRGR